MKDSAFSTDKSRILFVEDETVIREHLREKLSDQYDVDIAADGEEALKAVLRRRPHLIVTDLMMPTIDGVELVSLLRNTPSTATIPILMVSGRAPEELTLKGFELGADSFLRKPYSEHELRVRIRSMLRTTELRAEAIRVEARRRAEHEALTERAALLESISDAFYAVDRHWRFTYANQRALDYLGFSSREALIGQVLWDVVPVAKGSRFEVEYRRVLMSGEPAHFEVLSPYSQRWVDVNVYPTPQGIAVNFRDITDRKQSEAALRDLTATLEHRVEAAIAERDRAWNNTQDLLTVVTKDGVIRAANPAWTALLGWRVDEVVGSTYLDFTHPDDHHEARLAFLHTSEGSLRKYECRLRCSDASFRNVSWMAAPEGDFVYASGRDVTAEKVAIEALRQANARSRTIVETSYQYQGYIDTTGLLLDANRTSLADIRCDLREVVGSSFWETPWFRSTPGAAEDVKADFARAKQGETVRREMTLQLPVGRRTLDFSMRPVFDDAGTVVGIVPEAVDISERKSNAEQLAHMQKLETIGQLTGNVAHDFNNLLTPIVGVLDMLHRKYGYDERAQKLTAGALQSAERARLLVQKLLAFARKQHLDAKAVDIRLLLENLVDLLSRSIGPRVQISVEAQERLPAARVDPNQLELALLNLAINARDAMPEGGVLKIGATLERDASVHEVGGDWVVISVRDTGTGMDAATLSRAIEPFYTTKPPGQGTGLGLSMVHGLAAQSGGALVLSSTPGVGTTAILRLPVSEAPAVIDVDDTNDHIESNRSVTVLVVDDEDLVRASTANMLEDVGYAVIEAASGAQAIDLMQANPQIQAVVTDYAMPGMTGVQLAKSLRQMRENIPILMVTGFADVTESRAEGLPRLAKPFRQPELLARLLDLFGTAKV